MTVMQLRILLAQLPAECLTYPVAFHSDGTDVEAAVVLMCPPDGRDVVFPQGCVIIDRYAGTPDPSTRIKLYRPAGGR